MKFTTFDEIQEVSARPGLETQWLHLSLFSKFFFVQRFSWQPSKMRDWPQSANHFGQRGVNGCGHTPLSISACNSCLSFSRSSGLVLSPSSRSGSSALIPWTFYYRDDWKHEDFFSTLIWLATWESHLIVQISSILQLDKSWRIELPVRAKRIHKSFSLTRKQVLTWDLA